MRLTLMRFLPGVFMDAMRDNAEAAVHIFEGTHENPELIWNDNSREKVSTTVREMMLEYGTFIYLMTEYNNDPGFVTDDETFSSFRHFKQQKDNPDVNWKVCVKMEHSTNFTKSVVFFIYIYL